MIEASVTYRLDGKEWAQRFRAIGPDDAAFAAEAAGFGLTRLRWLDERQEWGLLTAPGGREP